MTGRMEVRQHFREQTKACGGVYCDYCKQHKPKVKLYRIKEMRIGDIVHAVCDDPVCIEKARNSRVADQWRRW